MEVSKSLPTIKIPNGLWTVVAPEMPGICQIRGGIWLKLDGVGPVDNRPSTDKLHHFVQKKHVTHDT